MAREWGQRGVRQTAAGSRNSNRGLHTASQQPPRRLESRRGVWVCRSCESQACLLGVAPECAPSGTHLHSQCARWRLLQYMLDGGPLQTCNLSSHGRSDGTV